MVDVQLRTCGSGLSAAIGNMCQCSGGLFRLDSKLVYVTGRSFDRLSRLTAEGGRKAYVAVA